MDNIKLYRAANFLSSPKKRPDAIVDPERDIPGAMANPWNRPMTSEFENETSFIFFPFFPLFFFEIHSAAHSITPVISKKNPTAVNELKRSSNWVFNRTPIRPAGIVPTNTNQVNLLNGSFFTPSLKLPWERSIKLEKKALIIANMSFQKYPTTATNVPTCKRVSNAKLDFAPSNSGKITKWAELLTGRNSVNP